MINTFIVVGEIKRITEITVKDLSKGPGALLHITNPAYERRNDNDRAD